MLVLTEKGFGKLTPLSEYPLQHRGGGGVRTFKIVDKTGNVVTAKVVQPEEQLMIMSAEGIVTCTPVKEKDPRQGITVQGRSTQGVIIMRLGEDDKLVAVAAFTQ
jgi:DNA gyrase subunit A